MNNHLNDKLDLECEKPAIPWLCLFMYSSIASMNWAYAYHVVSRPEVITNSWTILFPFLSYFYIVTCLVALVGIFYQLNWGYGLSFFTVIVGAFLACISYIVTYKLFPFVEQVFIVLIIFNVLVLLYMVIYSECLCGPSLSNDEDLS